jgi:hypothetical protein
MGFSRPTALLRALAAAAAASALLPAGAHAARRVLEQPAGGPAGSVVTFTGAGFRHDHRLVVKTGGTVLRRTRTDATGHFRVRVRIPAGRRSTLRIVAGDGRGRTHSRLTVSSAAAVRNASEVDSQTGARLRWTPNMSAVPGGTGLYGSGFPRLRDVTVSWLGYHAPVRTDARGFFSVFLPVPRWAAGVERGSVQVGRLRLPFSVELDTAGVQTPAGGGSPVGVPTPPAGGGGSGSADPVVAAAGDIACDPDVSGFMAPRGSFDCQQQWTAQLLPSIHPSAILGLGDFQYEDGTLDKYRRSYDRTWGPWKAITYPTPGNAHDQFGGGDYMSYWGSGSKLPAGTGAYQPYSFDLGAWHILSVPSGCTGGNTTVNCAAGGPIERFIRADMAAHPARCTLAFWHNPRWTTTTKYHSDFTGVAPFVQAVYDMGGDVILNGDNHDYERFAPRNPSGGSDPRGVTEFVAGTGGKFLMPFTATPPGSGFHDDSHFGVLRMTLHPASYDWAFVAEDGSVTDSGSAPCH